MQGSANLNRLDERCHYPVRTAEQNFTNLVLSHYGLKLQLASAIGVDEFQRG